MQADYFSRLDTSAPVCPVCGARHNRAQNGAGFLVWCDGSYAETSEEKQARDAYRAKCRAMAEETRAQTQERARLKRNARATHRRRLKNDRHGPIDAIDRGRAIPDTFPG